MANEREGTKCLQVQERKMQRQENARKESFDTVSRELKEMNDEATSGVDGEVA